MKGRKLREVVQQVNTNNDINSSSKDEGVGQY